MLIKFRVERGQSWRPNQNSKSVPWTSGKCATTNLGIQWTQGKLRLWNHQDQFPWKVIHYLWNHSLWLWRYLVMYECGPNTAETSQRAWALNVPAAWYSCCPWRGARIQRNVWERRESTSGVINTQNKFPEHSVKLGKLKDKVMLTW